MKRGGLGMVSVVIPVRDGARFLGRALESVLAQPEELELIVVDDGSVDGSSDVAARFPTLVVRQGARGPGAARNAGVERARGEYLAFLDADDVWLPGKLAAQLGELRAAASAAWCTCALEPFVDGESAPPPAFRAESLGRTLRADVPSALLLSRAAFGRVGPWREDLKTAEDVDWFGRAEALGLARAFVDEVLVRKRIHASNTSLVTPGNTDRLLLALRDRARARRP
jgi:glycosyltransferase involved in cell wall biosynthesis